MSAKRTTIATLTALLSLSAGMSQAADFWGLKKGTPELKSAGPLAFGPSGVLFIGDTQASTIFAIQTSDTKGSPAKINITIEGLNQKIATALKAKAGQITIRDLAVNPSSGQIYLSCMSADGPAVVKVDAKGAISQVALKDIPYSKVALANPPTGKGRRGGNRHDDSITDLAFVNGKLLVSGLTDSKSPSTVHEITFPFVAADPGASLEIYHGAHGREEDYSAIRTFVPMNIGGEPSLLAGFVCTPLVRVPLKDFASGKKFKGTTVAELGNRNKPLDMIVYEKEGKKYLLMANSARGVMKISTENLEKNPGITEKVARGETSGQPYETIEALKDVVQLDRLNDAHAVILVKAGDSHNLQTIALP